VLVSRLDVQDIASIEHAVSEVSAASAVSMSCSTMRATASMASSRLFRAKRCSSNSKSMCSVR
jgi:hypothetical protein